MERYNSIRFRHNLEGGCFQLSQSWSQVAERLLNQIKRLEKEGKERDRLELVRSMRFFLSALQRSLLGWMQWVNNPEIMTKFTQKDLEGMSKKLSEFTRSFIEYDLEVSNLGADKGLKNIKRIRRQAEQRPESFYV